MTTSALPGTAAVQGTLMQTKGLTPAQADAAFRTHMFITNTTNAIAEEKGFNPADPDFLKSKQYFDLAIGAIEKYCNWVPISKAMGVGTSRSVSKGNIDLSQIMQDIMTVIVDDESAGMFAGLSKLLEGGVDTGISNFMNFWWNHTHRTEANSSVSWGTATLTPNGFVSVPITYYNFDFELDDWRVLFVSAEHQSFTVTAGAVHIEIDMDMYLEYALPALKERQDGRIKNNILAAPGAPAIAA